MFLFWYCVRVLTAIAYLIGIIEKLDGPLCYSYKNSQHVH